MAGLEMTSEEEAALSDYLRHFRPTMQQLTPMLDRLKHDTKAEIGALIAAAHALVEADGVVRLQEVAYLQHDSRCNGERARTRETLARAVVLP